MLTNVYVTTSGRRDRGKRISREHACQCMENNVPERRLFEVYEYNDAVFGKSAEGGDSVAARRGVQGSRGMADHH